MRIARNMGFQRRSSGVRVLAGSWAGWLAGRWLLAGLLAGWVAGWMAGWEGKNKLGGVRMGLGEGANNYVCATEYYDKTRAAENIKRFSAPQKATLAIHLLIHGHYSVDELQRIGQ